MPSPSAKCRELTTCPESDLVAPVPVSPTRRLLMLGLGWTFVVLGLAGLVLPILQGILFLAIGFTILARHSSWAAARVEALRRRFPAVDAALDQASQRAAVLFRRDQKPPRA